MNTSKITVLVADDSYFVRKLVGNLLQRDPMVEIVGEAADGHEAVRLAAELRPRVVLMDYMMPGIDGVEATRRMVEATDPAPAVVMMCSYTEAGAEAALECLEAGAVDYLRKPMGETSLSRESIKAYLLEKVASAACAKVVRRGSASGYMASRRPQKKRPATCNLAVLGASSGGLNAIKGVIAALPGELPLAVVIAQRMPRCFTGPFLRRVGAGSTFIVKEIEEGERVRCGYAYVIPGGSCVRIEPRSIDGIFRFVQPEPGKRSPQPIDEVMMSVAKGYGARAVGVVLTGIGEDGVAGMRAIREENGCTIVQDPASAAFDALPSAVVSAGFGDEVIPGDAIAAALIGLAA